MTQGGDLQYQPKVSWWGLTQPPTLVTVTTPTWVGVQFDLAAPTRVWGMRVFMTGPSSLYRWALIWSFTTSELFAMKLFHTNPGIRPNNWLQCWIRPVLNLPADQYQLAVVVNSDYGRQNSALGSPVTRNGITFKHSWQSTTVYPPSATLTLNTNANGVDILVGPK